MRWAIPAAFLAFAAALAPARADEDSLSGKWRIERIEGADAFDTAKTSFELLPNGRVATTLGCNRMIGEPRIQGERISFGTMAATRMACPPPLDALERKYMEALQAVRAFRLDGPRLTLADEKGRPVILLRAAD